MTAIPDVTDAEGIQFPLDQTQKRGSSSVAKAIIYRALFQVDQPAAMEILQEKNWRKHYPHYFHALVAAGIQSPANAIQIAKTGLNEAWNQFEFVREGKTYSLADAIETFNQPALQTLVYQGEGNAEIQAWHVPYKGQNLQGKQLSEQLLRWEQAGVIEPSNRIALQRLIDHPEWFDLSDRTLVLCGAGSEAGPLRWLSRWKANIVAIDIPNPNVWQKIVSTVKDGNARLLVPVSSKQSRDEPLLQLVQAGKIGCNLLTQTPEIVTWLSSMPVALDIAAIAYLDGEKHVRISMALDAIMSTVSQQKPDTSLMYMATPTDIFAIKPDTVGGANQRYQQRSLLVRAGTRITHRLTRQQFFRQHMQQPVQADNGQQYGIADCLVIEQGPNYALAKRLQQWRAVLARSQGQRVSLNVAPSTTTASVVKNPLLKAAFAGAHLYEVEAFEPETTNALMAALWVHDLRCQQSAANPDTKLANPLELIMENANHGGLWRAAYLPRTVLPIAAVFGWAKLKAAEVKTVVTKQLERLKP